MILLGIGVSATVALVCLLHCLSQSFLFTAPWYTVFPGLTVVLLILGVGMIGEGIRERMGEIV